MTLQSWGCACTPKKAPRATPAKGEIMGLLSHKLCEHKKQHLRIEQTERLFGGPSRSVRVYCSLCGKTIIEGEQYLAVKEFILSQFPSLEIINRGDDE